MPTAETTKTQRGKRAYHSGVAAEQAVERLYERSGYRLLARRWRGRAGEIDLVFQAGNAFVFVEVKKSRSSAQAALHLSHRQQKRIMAAASEFVADQPLGMLSEMRFDVALLDGTGQIEIIENALGCN